MTEPWFHQRTSCYSPFVIYWPLWQVMEETSNLREVDTEASISYLECFSSSLHVWFLLHSLDLSHFKYHLPRMAFPVTPCDRWWLGHHPQMWLNTILDVSLKVIPVNQHEPPWTCSGFEVKCLFSCLFLKVLLLLFPLFICVQMDVISEFWESLGKYMEVF